MNKKAAYKRIKEYAREINYVERVFQAEMSKPTEQRDDALVNECLETLTHLRESADELYAGLDVGKQHKVNSFYWVYRPGLVIATVCLAIVLLSATVAQALGFRVWTALIHWDAGHLSVDYVPQNQGELSEQEIVNDESLILEEDESSGIKEYATMDEALRDLNIAPMLPSKWPEAFEATDVRARCNPQSIELYIKYESKAHELQYEISAYHNLGTAITITLPSDDGSYDEYESNNITYALSRGAAMTYVTWTNHNLIYSLISNLSYEEVLDIIDSLEVYEK